MKLCFRNYLYEAVSGKVTYVEPGTELFHGTGEVINNSLGVGPDEILWFSKSSTIAQTYIKCGITQTVSLKSLIKPPLKKRGSQYIIDIQKQLGIEFKVEYSSDMVKSYEIVSPDYFKQLNRDPNKDEMKIKYVKEQLAKFGYVDYDGDYCKLNVDDNGKILPANYKKTGKLYIASPKRKLKFYDISTGFTDENNPQYNFFKLFKSVESQGYDGIIIDDIAQPNMNHENLQHISYGVFKNVIKDLTFETIDACHPNYEIGNAEKDNPTEEYLNYKKSK